MAFGSLGKTMAHSNWYEKWSKSLEEVDMQEWVYIILRKPPADYVPQEGLGKLFYKGKALTKGSSASLRCLEVAVSVGGGWQKGMLFKIWFP